MEPLDPSLGGRQQGVDGDTSGTFQSVQREKINACVNTETGGEARQKLGITLLSLLLLDQRVYFSFRYQEPCGQVFLKNKTK